MNGSCKDPINDPPDAWESAEFAFARLLYCVLSASLRSRDDGINSWELCSGGVLV
jgi:hypothetical protein